MNFISPLVALEGFEPSLKVPETCVLPLHHKAIYLVIFVGEPLSFPFDDAKLQPFADMTKFFINFFEKNLMLFAIRLCISERGL